MSEKNKTVEPTYKFAEVPEGVINPIEPIKKQIAKTMEVTENFTVYDVMAYIAKMKKAREDKLAEAEGLEGMIKAYEDELALIEKALGVQKAEEEYQKTVAESQPVESPYEENDGQNEQPESGVAA